MKNLKNRIVTLIAASKPYQQLAQFYAKCIVLLTAVICSVSPTYCFLSVDPNSATQETIKYLLAFCAVSGIISLIFGGILIVKGSTGDQDQADIKHGKSAVIVGIASLTIGAIVAGIVGVQSLTNAQYFD